MVELGRTAHASRTQGVHHGCGHDGHTSMLIGAARQLTRTRRFDGTVHLHLPACGGRQGRRRRHDRGRPVRALPLRQRLRAAQLARPALGRAQTRPGRSWRRPTASTSRWRRRGGYAAHPHHTPDAILAASQQSRSCPPSSRDASIRRIGGMLSVTRIEGRAQPQRAAGRGLDHRHRAQLRPAPQDRIEAALRATVDGVALASGVQAEVRYVRYYPATLNTPKKRRSRSTRPKPSACRPTWRRVRPSPRKTSPSCCSVFRAPTCWLGQGRADPGPDGERALHHPCYDFNDDALPLGVRWLCEVAERALAG